jgi:hypothetical protein
MRSTQRMSKMESRLAVAHNSAQQSASPKHSVSLQRLLARRRAWSTSRRTPRCTAAASGTSSFHTSSTSSASGSLSATATIMRSGREQQPCRSRAEAARTSHCLTAPRRPAIAALMRHRFGTAAAMVGTAAARLQHGCGTAVARQHCETARRQAWWLHCVETARQQDVKTAARWRDGAEHVFCGPTSAASAKVSPPMRAHNRACLPWCICSHTYACVRSRRAGDAPSVDTAAAVHHRRRRHGHRCRPAAPVSAAAPLPCMLAVVSVRAVGTPAATPGSMSCSLAGWIFVGGCRVHPWGSVAAPALELGHFCARHRCLHSLACVGCG